ncbi:MAG: ribosome maturation factor RimP [Betaproteobacteria bacterium]|nr:ribosome maturation factor RimP [Betaproteobacteria bacterium]
MEQLLDNALTGLGYELVDFSRSRSGMLRIIIDCERGIALADCEQVSRHLENLLPVEGVAYERLEISSPGPDRPLTKPGHFARFCGQKAQVRLKSACAGRYNYTGMIAEADEQGLAMNCHDGVHRLEYSKIAKARLCGSFASQECQNDD